MDLQIICDFVTERYILSDTQVFIGAERKVVRGCHPPGFCQVGFSLPGQEPPTRGGYTPLTRKGIPTLTRRDVALLIR